MLLINRIVKQQYLEIHQLRYDEYFGPIYSELHLPHHYHARHCLTLLMPKPLFRCSHIDPLYQKLNLNEHKGAQDKSLVAQEFPSAQTDNPLPVRRTRFQAQSLTQALFACEQLTLALFFCAAHKPLAALYL